MDDKAMTGRMLITGAAARIGAEMAAHFAARGWHIILHYHSSETQAAEQARQIEAAGGTVRRLAADLSSETDVARLMEAATQDGTLTALVNNASLFRYDDAHTVSFDAIAAHMTVNLSAPALLTRLFYQQLEADEKGCVINMLDAKLFGINPDYFSYTLSKSALLCLNQISAQAYAPKVRVNGIAPGITLPSGGQTEAEFRQSHKRNLLGQGANLSEIVAAMELILSASSMTGEVIVLDGGAHLQPPARDVAFYEES
jgi:NAD(P)-dependent dehydrogenase (short-subunit alcohol dehydrogenase family)